MVSLCIVVQDMRAGFISTKVYKRHIRSLLLIPTILLYSEVSILNLGLLYINSVFAVLFLYPYCCKNTNTHAQISFEVTSCHKSYYKHRPLTMVDNIRTL